MKVQHRAMTVMKMKITMARNPIKPAVFKLPKVLNNKKKILINKKRSLMTLQGYHAAKNYDFSLNSLAKISEGTNASFVYLFAQFSW